MSTNTLFKWPNRHVIVVLAGRKDYNHVLYDRFLKPISLHPVEVEDQRLRRTGPTPLK